MVFSHIEKLVHESKYSFFTDLFRYLLKERLISEDKAVNDVKKELVNVENALKEANVIASSQNSAIVGALAYYRLANPAKYNYFVKWIAKNHIVDAKNIGMDDVISIFDKVYDSVPKKVFLARWYPASTDGNHDKARQRRDAIGKVLEDLNLELIDLGTQEGATYDIRSAMYKEITDSDIFIADLTGCRHNVMVEVGYALSSNKLNFDQLNPDKGRMLFYFASTTEHPG